MPTQIPQPTLSEADFLGEVNDLILFVTGLDQSKVFRGNQSRNVLPARGDFCIYTPITRKRIGTNIEVFDASGAEATEDGTDIQIALFSADIQVDFYGPNAGKYAGGLNVFAHSLQCLEWLRQIGYETRVLQCSDPQDITYVDDTKQYENRWFVTLSVAFRSDVEKDLPWFDSVNIRTVNGEFGLVNVDVKFKP